MSKSQEVIVDFVAEGEKDDEWLMVLVEEGPLNSPVDEFLHKLQDRLYNVIDAAIDGQLAQQFPQSKGKNVTIRLDCYDLPEAGIKDFYDAFSKGALQPDDYQEALQANPFVKNLYFEINFDRATK